jgi:hypothetical protein
MRPAIWPTVALTVAAFAIVGWAICPAAIGIGFSLMTEHGALILHAIVAPIAFAGLSWVYRMFLYMAS